MDSWSDGFSLTFTCIGYGTVFGKICSIYALFLFCFLFAEVNLFYCFEHQVSVIFSFYGVVEVIGVEILIWVPVATRVFNGSFTLFEKGEERCED